MGSKLSKGQVDTVCQRVYARFPLLDGVRPKIKSESAEERQRFLLSFETTVSLDDGKSLPIIVRAVTDANGRILKMSSSR